MMKLILAVLVFLFSSYCTTFAQERADSNLGEEIERWASLDDEAIDQVTKRNLVRIAWAIHAYLEDNEGALPPAAVPNDDIKAEKRLSGFVLLLPYIGVKPSYLDEEDEKWKKWRSDPAETKKLFDSIDLSKAWDDPANEEAAKTAASCFVVPQGGEYRNEAGYGLSHFAMVRGGVREDGTGLDNGPFPLKADSPLFIKDIKDGTINTLSVGQIHEELGPWIAAGGSTARHVIHPEVEAADGLVGFGSPHRGGGYFSNCDSFVYFFDFAAVSPDLMYGLSGRNDQIGVPRDRSEFNFESALQWKNSKEEK